MAHRFVYEITNKTWPQIFQSREAFELVVKEIWKEHHLEMDVLQPLTPGTNAVFRIGDKVVKIFAPAESGFYDSDFEIEAEAQRHANRMLVSSPRLLFRGVIKDKYLFRYIVMEYINGKEAGKASNSFSEKQKIDFAIQMKQITDKLNHTLSSKAIPKLTAADCLQNKRWQDFSEEFCNDRRSVIEQIAFTDCVYTHGDLTAENTIIGEDGTVYIIDFADSRIAPSFYEWPPLVFDLFHWDKTMLAVYFDEYAVSDFYDQLVAGLLIHEFGDLFVKQLCSVRNLPVKSLKDVTGLRGMVRSCLCDS